VGPKAQVAIVAGCRPPLEETLQTFRCGQSERPALGIPQQKRTIIKGRFLDDDAGQFPTDVRDAQLSRKKVGHTTDDDQERHRFLMPGLGLHERGCHNPIG